MPARRKVSQRQMELLLEFAESHRDIALGRFPGGPQAVRVIRDGWDSIAVQLNSVALGTTKTPEQWRRYWIEFKAKTKAKAADSRRNASATGGGPNKLVPLSDIEERVLALIGPVAVEGLLGVRLPIDILPAEETAAPAPCASIDQPPSHEPEPELVEWLDENVLSPSPPQPQPLALGAETQPTNILPWLEEQPDVSFREDRQGQRSTPPARRQRSQKQIHRDESVPRWAYNIEMRRIAAEERHATATEAIVELLRQIRDEIHTFVHRTG